jgi:hypothetical protein
VMWPIAPSASATDWNSCWRAKRQCSFWLLRI